MNPSKKSKKISELIGGTPRKGKMALQDVPNYDLINPIFSLYLMGDFDNMALEIAKYPYGVLDFFKCLQFYLKYWHKSEYFQNCYYESIVYEYSKIAL